MTKTTQSKTSNLFKYKFASFNINCISLRKLQDLVRSSLLDKPIAIFIQETKCLACPVLPGYISISNLSHNQHGVCTYINSEYSNIESIYVEHNLVITKLNNHFNKPLFLINFYNAYSSKSQYIQKLDPFFNLLKTYNTDENYFLFASDFNIDIHSNAFSKVFNLFESVKIPFCPNGGSPTCRNATTVDYFFSNISSNPACINLEPIAHSDHTPIGIINSFDLKLLTFNVSNAPKTYYINNALLSDDLISSSLRKIDIFSISSCSTSINDFFCSIEASIVIKLSCFLREKPSVEEKVKRFSLKNLNDAIPLTLSQPQQLKAISKLTNQITSINDFNVGASVLAKSDSIPVKYEHLSTTPDISSFSRSSLNITGPEVESYLYSMSPSKSSGLSTVSIRIMKLIPKTWFKLIADKFNSIQIEGFPSCFRFRKLVNIPKKNGSLRPICITSVFSKLYDLCLASRLYPYTSKLTPPNQTAYQKNRRGTEENLFVLKCITELFPDTQIHIFDFKAAFNCLCNFIILQCLIDCNIPENLVYALCDSAFFYVVACPKTGQYQIHCRGVGQGGCFSGILFTCALFSLSKILNSLKLNQPIYLGQQQLVMICHLIFADDLLIISRCPKDSKLLINAINEWSYKSGLPLNQSKCATLKKINCDAILPTVSHAEYLGLSISFNGTNLIFKRFNTNFRITARIEEATKRLKSLHTLKNCMKTFHMGPYGLFLVFAPKILQSKTPMDFFPACQYLDSHFKNLVADFCRYKSPHLLSIRKITKEFGIQSNLACPSIIRYSANFLSYVENLPRYSFANCAIYSSCPTVLSLKHARNNLLPQLSIFEHNSKESFIFSLNKLNLIKFLPLLVSIDSGIHPTTLRRLKLLLELKKFAEANTLIRSLQLQN